MLQFDRQAIARKIDSMGFKDFSNATIRDIQSLSKEIEKITGQEFIHLEMGVPGLPYPNIAIEAEHAALSQGCAKIYPPNGGIPRIKNAASQFVKAFVGIDIDPLGCIPTTGSMQATYATFTAWHHAFKENYLGLPTVLFIHPGFPVQTTQCDVVGMPHIGIDIYDLRGEKLIHEIDLLAKKHNICGIVYSNPNNPTWTCLDEQELNGIGELATKHDFIVLEDLAYFAMDFRKDLSHPYEPPYQATVAHYTHNYILTISASKVFSYAGQRIGVCCISDALYHRNFIPLAEKFGTGEFGDFYTNRLMYTLSSGTTHSVQHAMAAMMEASCNGKYDFLDTVKEYGRRAKYMKEVLLVNGFYLVYDNDQGEVLADGFYFTVQYPNMSALELTRELMFYGIAVFPLNTMGSTRQGVRICTSFFSDEQRPLFQERIEAFYADHK